MSLLFTDTIIAKLRRNAPYFGRDLDVAGKLDKMQQGKVQAMGVAITGVGLTAFTYNVTTGAATGLEMFKAVAPFKFQVVDVIVQPRNTSTNGTLKITNGTNDITDAMVCATDKTMVRPATIDDAYSTIAKDGTLEIVCAGDTVGNTKALVTVLALPID